MTACSKRISERSTCGMQVVKIWVMLLMISVIPFGCGRIAMEKSIEEFFVFVDSLLDQRPYNRNLIEKVFDCELHKIDDQSNEYFSIYETKKGDRQDSKLSIELRIPTSKSNKRDGILIIDDLDINQKTCVVMEDVIERYGEGEFTPASPQMPVDLAEQYISYVYSWGKISYGFNVSGKICLRTLVIDATRG